MKVKRVNVLGCPVDAVTMDETVRIIDESIKNNQHLHHVVVNAAKLVNMKKDKELYDSVVSCNIINADGQSVVWAGKLLGQKLPERVAGIDLMQNLVKLAGECGYKVFLFGAKEEIVSSVANKYSTMYSPEIIAGYRNGYYSKDEEHSIAETIGTSGAHMLFVAISSPKKEIFLNEYKGLINIPFVMGVGGSFDVIAGKVKRAPNWMQQYGLEWFYRFCQEPRRMLKRYFYTNSMFIFYLTAAMIRKLIGLHSDN